MGGAVFLPCWLFGLRCPSTGPYTLLDGARSWLENGGLQEGSHQWVLPRNTSSSVSVPSVSHSCPLPPHEALQYQQVYLVQALMKSLLFIPWVLVCTKPRVCPPIVEFLFPLILWNSCNQTPMAFKGRFSGGSSSHCPTPRLGSLTWGLRTFTSVEELLWYNYFAVCGSPTRWVWNLIWSWLHPSYHHILAASLSLDVWYHFWYVLAFFSPSGCSAVSYDFDVLVRRGELIFF